jgi:hypothetical protein
MNKRILLVLLVFVGGYFLYHSFNKGPRHASASAKTASPAQQQSNQHADPLAKADPSTVETPIIHASFRPLNFALLRGGFSSVDEFFQRVHDDPVLHSFYGDCADRNASMHALPEDITAFSTFRKGNQIQWAQKPLLIKKGEYVMTFCGKTVLARCGNLISVSPMQPSEDVPPALLETSSETPAAPLTLVADAGSTPVNPADAAAPTAAVVPAAHSHRFFFIPPFYVPQGSSHSSPPPSLLSPTPPSPPPPPPPGHITGDEFSGHQAMFTLFIGLFVIALLKLTTR